MTSYHTKRFVIDASVVRAAGGVDARAPSSKACRDFLTSILDICHHIVMSNDLKREWEKHLSTFARKWRHQMRSRRKIYSIDSENENDNINRLAVEITTSTGDEIIREIMMKDIHLITAASETDKIIISNEKRSRRHFVTISQLVHELQSIQWVDPCENIKEKLDWLQQGAPFKSDYSLNSSV